MRLLLDTCTFLWLAADDARLTPRARSTCRSPDNAVFLSAVCAWEISIKHRLGRFATARAARALRGESARGAPDRAAEFRRIQHRPPRAAALTDPGTGASLATRAPRAVAVHDCFDLPSDQHRRIG